MKTALLLRRGRRGGSAGNPITATTAPALSGLDDTRTPSDGFTPGTYASSAGTIVSQVAAFTVDGAAAEPSKPLVAGQVVAAAETVTDSVGNERTFSAGSVTVSLTAPVFVQQPSFGAGAYVVGETVTFDLGDVTPSGTLTVETFTLGGVSKVGELSGETWVTTGESAGTIEIVARATNAAGFSLSDPITVALQAADVTAPIVSALAYEQAGNLISANSNEAGTARYIVNTSSTLIAGSSIKTQQLAGTPLAYGSFAAGTGEVQHTPNFAALVEGTTYWLHLTVEDAAGNFSTDVPGPFTLDLTAPTVTLRAPADGDTHVPTTVGEFVKTYSEPIFAGVGTFTLRHYVSGAWANAETFLIPNELGTGSGQVEISGNSVTLRPGITLVDGRDYAIQNSADALRDIAGNPIAAVNDDSSWNFTISDSPPTTINFTSVNANGWSVTYPSPPTFNPAGTAESFEVSREGFTTAGAATTYVEDRIYTERIRQAYPNQASLTTDQVALDDYIYSTDTITGKTNNSTETSPKPVANWAMLDRALVGNTVHLEVVAAHRNARDREEVACVEFRATDGSTTVTQIVSTSSILGHAGDANPVIGYACDLDISTLANPATITVNAKVYPWIGGAASVLNSSDQSAAREFSPRTFRRDTTLAAAPYVAYVDASTGNDTSGVASTTAATALASPCLTIAGAINKLHTAGGIDGGEIRLKAGTHAFTTTAIASTRTQSHTRLTITRDPATTKAAAILTFGAAAPRPRLGAAGGWLRIHDITVTRTGTSQFTGEAASILLVDWESVAFNNASYAASALGSNVHQRVEGMVVTNGVNQLFNPATPELRLARGIVMSGGYNVEGWLVLGCALTASNGVTRGSRTSSGAFVGFNRILGIPSTGLGISIGFSENVLGGAAVIQNVLEHIGATAITILQISHDNGSGDTSHIILHHNTVAGFNNHGRSNLFYDDTTGDARTHKLMSCRGNIHVQINTKHDVFKLDGTRVGGWSYLYGVGCQGEFSRYADAQGFGGFGQEYPGLDASIGTTSTAGGTDPLFVSYAGTTQAATAGAGNGNYAIQSGSPAKARVDPILRFDLAGAARSAAAASAGAYE